MAEISFLSAILIVSEIGVNMTIMENASQRYSWATLVPCNNESARKKKATRITKAGQYLKPLLVQFALATIKNPKSYFRIKSNRIKKRRGHKKAIIAIACMMLVCICNLILIRESFKPSNCDELMNPKSKKPKELTIESAIDFHVKSVVKPEIVISAFSQTLQSHPIFNAAL